MGTPLYMSPEQCRDSAATDARTDLYSLGCVLFEMLTGQPPFTLDTMGELIVAHLTVQPRDVRALRPSVPEALSRLVAELLNKEPNERPADMHVVGERLAAFVIASTTIPDSAPAAAMAGAFPPASRAAGSLAPPAASQPGPATAPPPAATSPPAASRAHHVR